LDSSLLTMVLTRIRAYDCVVVTDRTHLV